MARREEQIELNLGGLLRQVYTAMFSSRAECMTPTLPRDRRFESLVLQQGVRNEPCGTWGSRSLILLQRRASCDLTSWINRAARIRCGSVCEVACASRPGPKAGGEPARRS